MAARLNALEQLSWRALSAADAACNRLYGWKGNPLYQSGTIVVALLATLVVTGIWLLLFYRIGSPWHSVADITAARFTGNWVRGLHRYASDAAVVASLVHLFRLFAQGRSWGPRALAWVTGVLLLALIYVCGWTGYVMVWDEFGQVLAREGARMLDTLPVFSEPVIRIFAGEKAVPSAFFFVNLFAHVALPLAMAVGLWLHVSRVARVNLLPPRVLLWSVIGALTALSILRPISIGAEASAFRLAETVTVDLFYAFWLPWATSTSAVVVIAIGLGAFALLAAIPLLTRRGAEASPPSHVDEEICVGCRQCALDCPYEAITMLERAPGGRSEEVARVNPDLCVSCGICAGSCAPMGVGPPGRTGRDQLVRLREFLADPWRRPGELIVIGCDRAGAGLAIAASAERATPYFVDCAGSVHSSVIELMIRAGCSGVLVLACPPRDCWNREGPRWLHERVYNDREAELQARVDRRRVRIGYVDTPDVASTRARVAAFRNDLETLEAASAAGGPEPEFECVPAEIER
jgi:ferredoxin